MIDQRRPRALASNAGVSAVLVALVVLFAAACGSSDDLPAAVVETFDVRNNFVADLTTVGDEEVPAVKLVQATERAVTTGTELRVVIAGENDELVSAESVVDAYGGTALSYKANQKTFEAASKDISGDQLDRALGAAGRQGDMGDSAAAFVEVIESEGIQGPGTSLGTWLLVLALIGAALFMVAQGIGFWNARKRRLRRQKAFIDRQAILRDWGAQLQPQIDGITPLVDSQNLPALQTLRETQAFASTIVGKVGEASSLGELDQAEMRIGRNAIKLRDLQRSLSS